MRNDNEDLQSKYQKLVADYNRLIEENRTLYEIKNDTIQAIEIFKSLQEESTEREKAYQQQIGKLQMDKRHLHMDRTRLTKQLLNKHRDMIILNQEIDKFRDPRDYESRFVIQLISFLIKLKYCQFLGPAVNTTRYSLLLPSCTHQPSHRFFAAAAIPISHPTPSQQMPVA